jgi:predicted O-linked N-acetylglucosamine transferase (SPINDLY family)
MSNSEKVERLHKTARDLHLAGRLDEADQAYQHILALHRSDVEARHMLAVLTLQRGRPEEALRIIDTLAIEKPAHAEIRTHRGLILADLGRHEEAMADFDLAQALKPGNALTLLYRGNLLLEMDRLLEALQSYDQLLLLTPNDAEVWFRRANTHWLLDRFEDALAGYGKAVEHNPGHVGALFNSGTTLLKLDRYAEALATFQAVEALAPDNPYVLGGFVSAVSGGCDLALWEDCRQRLIPAVRGRKVAIPPLLLMPFSDDEGLGRICSETFVVDRVPSLPPKLWNGEQYKHEKIRLAYLSSDFHQHATAQLIAGLIECHDRDRFEVVAISFSRDDSSAMRARLVRAFDNFLEARASSDAEIAQLLRASEFDIAVDLKGHTEGARPGILAHRPCPVQVSYLGYAGTIGAPWLDYILADATVLPFDRQPHYSEKIVHLPGCYQVNDGSRTILQPPARTQAGLPQGAFVFCCFNAAWKITPAMFDVWARLLIAVPGSVLWLLDDNDSAKANLVAAALIRGLDPVRLVFARRTDAATHLARHALADLFLDTLPYNAHTSASDALWAGLPLVTCRGKSFDGRVAASLLKALGLEELTTETLADYEALALALAQDRSRLSGLRTRLAETRISSGLFDAEKFRTGIEAAYLQMVNVARKGAAPQSFSV